MSDTATAAESPDEEETNEAAASPSPSKRRLLEALRRRILQDPRSYSVAALLDEDIEAVYDGPGVTGEGGKLRIVGRWLASMDGLFDALGASTIMNTLEFGSSVRVELRPFVPKKTRERARALAEKDPDAAVEDDLLRELIPDSVVAARAVADLIATPAQDAIAEARRYGRGVADAYVTVARTIADGAATLTVSAPGREPARMGSRRARLVVQQLEERDELSPRTLTIVGKLTRTDSEEEKFRVVLDRATMPVELDGRRRVIEGSYSARASRQVQDNGLWDTQVVAKVRAWPVRDPLHPQPLLQRFRFIDIRARL
jgi:hypothetical protein